MPRGLAIWTAVAAILLALSRPTSPLDVAIVAIVLACRRLARTSRETEPESAAIVDSTRRGGARGGHLLVIGGPPRLTGTPLAHPVSLLSNMSTSFGLTGTRLRQMVGDFGWLDTPVPTWVVAVWATCLAGLTAAALFLSAPCRRALPVLAVLILAMPLALESPQIDRVGTYWQGRYSLRVAVGFPLIAATFEWRARRAGPYGLLPASRRWITPTLTLALGLLLFAGQVASFQHALTRYEIGLGVRPQSPLVWLPPGGHAPVEVLFVVGSLVTLAMVVVMTARQWENPRQSEGVVSSTLTSS